MSTRFARFAYLSFFAITNVTYALDDVSDAELESLGWQPVESGSGTGYNVPNLLRAEFLVESKRLSRGELQILQINKRLVDTGILQDAATHVAIYRSVGPDGEVVFWRHDMDPEAVQRLRAATVSPAEQMALVLRAYSSGAVAVGAVIENEVASNELAAAFGIGNDARVAQSTAGPSDISDLLGLSDSEGVCGLANYRPPEDDNPITGDFKPEGPWVAISPLEFMAGQGCVLSMIAFRLESFERMSDADRSERRARDGEQLQGDAFATGIVNVGGHPTYGIRAENLDQTHTGEDGTTTTINAMEIWIDVDHMVRRKTRLEGVIAANGESRQFFIENEKDDFRSVAGTNLYEPYREAQRMGGMLSPDERAQMQEAKQKLDEFERQLASMPAAQRQMMENMMGSQMEQFRKLADDGVTEVVWITTGIIINPDLTATSLPLLEGSDQPSLIQIIQQHLLTLGYYAGDVDGELSKTTVVAITKYEAANGMPVTGQATPQLAGILSAAVDTL